MENREINNRRMDRQTAYPKNMMAVPRIIRERHYYKHISTLHKYSLNMHNTAFLQRKNLIKHRVKNCSNPQINIC